MARYCAARHVHASTLVLPSDDVVRSKGHGRHYIIPVEGLYVLMGHGIQSHVPAVLL